MSEEHPKKRWGVLQWGVVSVVVLLGLLLLSSQFTYVSYQAPQMKAYSNAKQVIIALRHYASQRGGIYPSGVEQGAILTRPSSNRMFRELFEEEIVTNERIFGCPESPFVPDNKIGEAPLFPQAMQPGENHWMMLRDQTDTSFGNTPIIIENALTTTWPPRWDMAANGQPKAGRAWKNGQIIVGWNDGSIHVCKLLPDGTLDGDSPGAKGPRAWADHLRREGQPLPEFAPVE